ncbi:hypothetical protein ESA_pESA3p05534 (plasmid) [Cronobacter sakazakii ATCC BAA-894]|uniref:Uncharacterized protein n=1 Tax=Cronobacter sakazakii (strain ATCC BAA-894) TaxID=290339 RepID=A7MRD7_CROS8|nr:hypothetical protein ESA_pESA3p05534 [Cronobacter sakazakii ATCC BAA-894]
MSCYFLTRLNTDVTEMTATCHAYTEKTLPEQGLLRNKMQIAYQNVL